MKKKPSKELPSRTEKRGDLSIMWCAASRRFFATSPLCRCAVCKQEFTASPAGWEQTPIVVTDEQISIMRGDDITKFYHPECFEKESKHEQRKFGDDASNS